MRGRPDLNRPTPTARSSARHIRRLKAQVGSIDQETTVTTPANKRALDAAGTEARMDAVRLKHMLGGALTEQERMCLQIEQNGFGCGSCSSPTYVVDARAKPATPDKSGSA
jgi:hypothetical protein